MDELKIFVPLTKVDVEKRLVFGCIAAEVADKAAEIMDYESAKPQFEAWSAEIAKASDGKSVGNLRAMHGNIAAGKLTTINFDDEAKRIEACGKVVDDAEWNKVLEGVYTGFSMGGKYLKRWKDADQPHLTRYTPAPAEVSLVDNPCIPTTTFEVIKADGTTEMRKFHTATGETPTNVAPDVEQGWKAKDGSFHATKAAALKKNTEIDADAAAKAAAAPAQTALGKLDAALKGTTAPASVAEADDDNLGKKAYSADERKKMAAAGEAKDDGSYPIKTATDVENAVKDFGRSKGSASDKKHIIARAKAIGATDSLPADWPGATKKKTDADKASRVEALRKSLWDVARIAAIISDLKWIQEGLAAEAQWEGDNSPAPDVLQTLIEQLGKFLCALATEETGELSKPGDEDYDGDEYDVIELAAKAIGLPRTQAITKALPAGPLKRALEKAGARHSKTDQSRVQKAHDMAKEAHDNACDLGADCTCGKTDGASDDDADKHAHGELAKVAAENAALRKSFDELAPKIDAAVAKIEEQGKEIERLNAQPAGGGPVVNGTRTVTKGQDAGTAESDPGKAFQKHLATLVPSDRALALMKFALANPTATAPEPVGKRA